jgi:hypothetical protein
VNATAETQPQPTPGYNCRLMIYFAVQGETRVAYRWSPRAMRAIRVPLADALIWKAGDMADVLPYHPLKGPQ